MNRLRVLPFLLPIRPVPPGGHGALTRWSGWPLSYHLIVLTLAIMLPLLVLAGISLSKSFESEREAAHRNTQRIVDNVMARLDREILSAITILNVLANDTAFDRGEFQLLYQRAREGLNGRKGRLLLIGTDNKVIFDTSVPFSGQQHGTLADPMQAPPTLVKPAVTDLFIGGPGKQRQFAVIVPVVRDGQAVARLRLSFQPQELSAAFTEPALPEGWKFALGDGKGMTILSIGPFAEEGQVLPQPLLEKAVGSSGMISVSSEDPLLVAYQRSRVTGWLGFALIPIRAIEAPLVKIWNEFFATGILLMALSVLAAYLLSRTMTQPIYALTRAAMELGTASPETVPRSSLLEANVLAQTMSTASLELRERTEALSSSERRFRMFAEQTPDVIWFLDVADDKIEFISPAFEQIWGRTPQEIKCMKDWRGLVYPDDLPVFDAGDTSAGSPRSQIEYRIQRPDGGLRWVRDTRFLLEQADDHPRLIAGILRDFTARKEAIDGLNSARAEAESRLGELERLYETAPIGLAVVGRDYRLQRINKFMAGVRGADPENLLGRPLFELLPQLEEIAVPLLEQILAGGKAMRGVEFQSGGTPEETIAYWVVHFYPITGDGSVVQAIGVILEDVTGDKLHRRALAGLAAIVHAANDAMFSTNPAGLVLNWNPAAETLFGYSSSEAIGMPLSTLFLNGRSDDYRLLLEDVHKGESARLDTELRRKDDSTFPVSISIAPIKDEGEMTAVSVSIEDITERKRFEERQLLMNRELSHRVKNSLAVIQAMARHTLRSSPNPEAFTAAFEGRLQALSTSHNLLTDTHWEGAEMRQLIRDQLTPLMIGADRLVLSGTRVNLPPGIVTSLGLVLHELGTNAIKYGSLSVPGGRVEVAWEVTGTGRNRKLRLDWREVGGPPVTEPKRSGFGSTLIQYSGKVEQIFAPGGLHCTVEMSFSDEAPKAF